MAKLTRSNVAHDLNISPHKLTIEYYQQDITFVFSSEYNRNRFCAKLAENRDTINLSISNRFGFEFQNDVLCDIKLYSIVEKRGFLILIDGEKIECLNRVNLHGAKIHKSK